jgi:hypothetical protein
LNAEVVATHIFLKNYSVIIVSVLTICSFLLISTGGFDGVDVNWECKSNLPAGLTLSHVVVGCEGYNYPTDPYILRDSCQVIVSLNGDNRWNYVGNERSQESSSLWSFLLFLGLIYILYKIFQHFQTQQQFSSPGGMGPVPSSQWSNPGGGWNFWSNLGWAGFLGSMFAPRLNSITFFALTSC